MRESLLGRQLFLPSFFIYFFFFVVLVCVCAVVYMSFFTHSHVCLYVRCSKCAFLFFVFLQLSTLQDVADSNLCIVNKAT